MTPISEARFPEELATSVKRSEFHVIENRDISAPADLQQLLRLLYDHPERTFYVFVQKHAALTDQLRLAIDSQDILVSQTDLEFYQHSQFPRDYVRITKGQETFDWEREVMATQTEYLRMTLTLSTRKRRDMEIVQHLNAHSQAAANPFELKPNVWGIGVDLKKAWGWLRAKLRKR